MSCANTAEPIKMPFGVRTRVGTTNHVLGGGLVPQREGACSGPLRTKQYPAQAKVTHWVAAEKQSVCSNLF